MPRRTAERAPLIREPGRDVPTLKRAATARRRILVSQNADAHLPVVGAPQTIADGTASRDDGGVQPGLRPALKTPGSQDQAG